MKKEHLNKAKTRHHKQLAQKNYQAAHKEVKASIKRDKRHYYDELAREGEEAAVKGNLRQLYENTKRLNNKWRCSPGPIKDSTGKLLTSKNDQVARWAEYFKLLLNQPPPAEKAYVLPADTDLDISCELPTEEEIAKAIRSLHPRKAAGPDNVPPEILRSTINESVEIFLQLFTRIWDEEKVPQAWKMSNVVKIPKKGDLQNCGNYRGISLLSVPGKVLSRILLERMRQSVDSLLRENQAGFRQHRSCTDQIATLRIIIEESLEWNSPLYISFVDFEKAFDSIDRDVLWAIMRHYGIPDKIVRIVKSTYDGATCRVVHEGQLSEAFEVVTGGRQGCLLTPFLFLLVIDWIMVSVNEGRRTGIQWGMFSQLDDLDFADDLALLSHSRHHMQEKTSRLEETAASAGLRINRTKTKVMRVRNQDTQPITLKTGDIEEVTSFTYLGSVVSATGGTEEDIKARLNKARVSFRSLDRIWRSSVVSRSTKLRIFRSNVLAVLLYGAESWRTTKSLINKVQVFINNSLRRICGIRWPEKMANRELWKLTGQDPVEMVIKRRRWSWIGHTLRRSSTSITRQALRWTPQGCRHRGRPKNTWKRSLEKEMRTAGLSWTDMDRRAQDRAGWRDVVCGLCSTPG